MQWMAESLDDFEPVRLPASLSRRLALSLTIALPLALPLSPSSPICL